MRNLPYPTDILSVIYCWCPFLKTYEVTCGSEIATVQALCGMCCMSVHLQKKKIEVMDEVKEDRGSHLIGALRNCQNELNNFYYYSLYAAHID